MNVTANPTAAWVTQQLREALPFTVAPRYLLLDRDSIFSAKVCRVLRHMDVRPVRTSFQSPWQKGCRGALGGNLPAGVARSGNRVPKVTWSRR